MCHLMLFQAFTGEASIKSRRMPGLFTQRLQLKALHFHITFTFRPPLLVSLSPYSYKGTIPQIKSLVRAKKVAFPHLTLAVLHLTFQISGLAVILVALYSLLKFSNL